MLSSPGPLLNSLPAIYHASEDLRQLLSVFERVLFGADARGLTPERRRQSLSQVLPLVTSIATIASVFDPDETPKELLPWLAQWVALSQLSGLPEPRQRELLAEIVPIYAQRGTKPYLARLLAFFTPENATVSIEDQELYGFIVGTAKIGLDSQLEHDRPFWFRVRIRAAAPAGAPEERREFWRQWEERIRWVIDLAKPAHTLYELDWQFEGSDDKT
jgi:phage tail-like protein